jgi:hypothetical protein
LTSTLPFWTAHFFVPTCFLEKNKHEVHYLLTKLGLSWISARSKHPKQDKEAQALYKKLQTKGNRCLT